MFKKKFNIVDYIIIIVLLFLILGIGYRYTSGKDKIKSVEKDKVEISFYAPEKLEFLGKAIKIDSIAKDNVMNSIFGKVKAIELKDAISNGSNEIGEFVASKKQGYNSVLVKVVGEGIYTDNGVSFDNISYYIGKTVELRAGNVKIEMRVYDLKKIKE